jgi:hypothetical protein
MATRYGSHGVYKYNGYNASQVSAIESGFTNWQSSSAGNSVTYSFVQVTTKPSSTGHWAYVYQAVPTPQGTPNTQLAAFTSAPYSLANNNQIG